MIRACRWLAPLALLGTFYVPAPLAGQFNSHIGLEPLATRTLYILGRQKAERINKECTGDLDVYLDGVAYLYAYHQAANKDGSLQRDPRFAQVFGQQFTEVVDRARRCLKAYAENAAAASRDENSSSRRTVVDPGITLPDAPPSAQQPEPSVDFSPERAGYVAQIAGLEQQRDALAAEVNRLRSLLPATPASPPPVAPTPVYLNTEYRIRAKANNLYWHLNFGADNLLSTRIQSNDDFAKFIVVGSGDGAYRIQNKATGRYLYASGAQSGFLVSSTDLASDPNTRFLLFPEPDGSYRIQSQATGRFLSQEGDANRFISSRYQPEDDYVRFFFDR
jgi:ricin-type beta-trefoil lectin protein